MSSYYVAEELSRVIITAILKSLVAVGKAGVSVISSQIYKSLTQEQIHALQNKGDKKEVRRLLYYMKRRGYVEKSGYAQNSIYTVTDRGEERLKRLQLKPLGNKRKSEWDGKWRVILYDIPEKKRQARNVLRQLIKKLGFIRLQKSAWIHPYDCEEEVSEIQEAYGVKEHITLLVVDDFDQLKVFKEKFDSLI